MNCIHVENLERQKRQAVVAARSHSGGTATANNSMCREETGRRQVVARKIRVKTNIVAYMPSVDLTSSALSSAENDVDGLSTKPGAPEQVKIRPTSLVLHAVMPAGGAGAVRYRDVDLNKTRVETAMDKMTDPARCVLRVQR